MSLFMKTELLQITKKLRKTLQVENTVWKLQKFSVTQILREINFGEGRTYRIGSLAIALSWNFENVRFSTLA